MPVLTYPQGLKPWSGRPALMSQHASQSCVTCLCDSAESCPLCTPASCLEGTRRSPSLTLGNSWLRGHPRWYQHLGRRFLMGTPWERRYDRSCRRACPSGGTSASPRPAQGGRSSGKGSSAIPAGGPGGVSPLGQARPRWDLAPRLPLSCCRSAPTRPSLRV